METLIIYRKASYKVLRGKRFNITENTKHDGYQRGLASVIYKFFHKKSSYSALKLADKSAIKSEIMSNQQ